MAKKKNEELTGDSDEEYVEEQNFEDPPGFVDDVSEEGKFHSDFLERPKVKKMSTFQSIENASKWFEFFFVVLFRLKLKFWISLELIVLAIFPSFP